AAVRDGRGSDLRGLLATRTDSLVVLYSELPTGCFFQSGDGAATRESLRDPTVRSYFLNSPPFGLEPGRFALLWLDENAQHLRDVRWPPDYRSKLAASSVAAGDGAH